MKKNKSLVLVGMPGSGKSTLGKALAKKLGLPFIDLDHKLEEREGCSIPELFESRGEAYFRQRESELLKEVLKVPSPFVLATGGGTPCFFDNMQHIREHAVSVYLEVNWPLLAQRLAQQPGQRPLLKGLSAAEFTNSLEEKFGWRILYYQQAQIILKVEEGKDGEELAEQLVYLTR